MARKVANPKLNTRTARRALEQRREPYWQPLSAGCAVGYRKGAKSGTWIARWRTPAGKHTYHSLGPADDVLDTDMSFDEAQERARAWFAEMERTLGRRSDYSVENAIDDYVDYLRRERAPTTAYDSEKRAAKYIVPELGDKRVRALTRADLMDWWRGIYSPGDDEAQNLRSKDSANHILTILKAALNRAYQHRDDVPTDDPWRRLKPFKGVGAARKVFLTEKQCKRLVNACSGGFRDLVLGSLLTGARPPGELREVRARDFDAKAGTLYVNGKTGPRDIHLDDQGVAFFKTLTAGLGPDDLVFTKDDGSPWGRSHQTRPWKEAAKRAKLPKGATMYSLRHTYASLRLLAGMNHQILAENMGTSIRMLEKHYGKFMQQDRRDAMNDTAFDLKLPTTNVTTIPR